MPRRPRVATGNRVYLAQARQILRRILVLSPEEIIGKVASNHKVETEDYVGFRSSAAGRTLAALLCRSLTNATLAELSIAFGLRHKDSSANLVRRAKRMEQKSKSFNNRLAILEKEPLKTENQDWPREAFPPAEIGV